MARGSGARDAAAIEELLDALAGQLEALPDGAGDRVRTVSAEVRQAITPAPAKLPDPLRARVVELVVAADRLNAEAVPSATDHPAERVAIPRQTLAIACRTLTQWLAEQHPGRSVEVRVPPFAAVQCGIGPQGPTHTRGTPPNVIETDPVTFLRLATGRLSWDAARSAGKISASGQRADLSPALPIARL